MNQLPNISSVIIFYTDGTYGMFNNIGELIPTEIFLFLTIKQPVRRELYFPMKNIRLYEVIRNVIPDNISPRDFEGAKEE